MTNSEIGLSAPVIFLRTQNRVRKYEKMSERTRCCLGIALVLISIVLCLVSPVLKQNSEAASFQPGNRTDWELKANMTEVNGTVCLNAADAEELTELPGIGETLSRLIIKERTENGPYYYAEDLEAVKGIGPATLEKFREMIDLTQEEGGE